MKISKVAMPAALLAASIGLAVEAMPASATAMPSVVMATSVGAPASQATPVWWRQRWGGWGPGAGLGIIGGVIIGGALIANAVAERRADDGAMRACARDFPDFSWRTGTFVDNYGHRRVCPYLQ